MSRFVSGRREGLVEMPFSFQPAPGLFIEYVTSDLM